MPLYEYQCKECARRTEKIQKYSDAELTVCPHCGGGLERTLTAPAIQFKGGGWYKDLYSSAKPAASGSESAGSGGDSSASKSAESAAPAATAPAASTPAAAPAAGNASGTSGSSNP